MDLNGFIGKLHRMFTEKKENMVVVLPGTEGIPFASNCDTYMVDGISVGEPIICQRFEFDGVVGMALEGQQIPHGARRLNRVMLIKPSLDKKLYGGSGTTF